MSEYSPTRKGVEPKLPEEYDDRANQPLVGAQSPGVARIEAINAHLTSFDRWFLGIGVFLIAYAYGLDGTVRYTYQVIASSSIRTASGS